MGHIAPFKVGHIARAWTELKNQYFYNKSNITCGFFDLRQAFETSLNALVYMYRACLVFFHGLNAYRHDAKNYIKRKLFRILFILLVFDTFQFSNLRSTVLSSIAWIVHHFWIQNSPRLVEMQEGRIAPGASYTFLP